MLDLILFNICDCDLMLFLHQTTKHTFEVMEVTALDTRQMENLNKLFQRRFESSRGDFKFVFTMVPGQSDWFHLFPCS